MRLNIIIPIVLLIAACKQKQQSTTTSLQDTVATTLTLTEAQVKNAGIQTGIPAIRTIHTSLRVNGVIAVPPQNLVSVTFPMGGYVKSTTLLPGAAVRKGQVIAVLADPAFISLQQDYLVAKSRMTFLSVDMQRQRELNQQEAVSEKQYQQVLADFSSQQVLVKSYEEKLRLIGIHPGTLTVNSLSGSVAIRSPINGFVSKVNVNIGRYVNPSDVLFELVNASNVYATFNVFEKDLASFYPGLRGAVALVDDQQKKYAAEVMLVRKNIDETRTGEVHCRLKNIDDKLLPGMFLVADFNLASRQVYAVPDEAITRYSGKLYLFRQTGNNNYKMMEVATGSSSGGYTELIDEPGMQWNQQSFVYKGAYALLGNLKNKMDE